MEQGAVTKDGYNLAEDLTVYEQEKLKEYIYCMAFDEMKKTVESGKPVPDHFPEDQKSSRPVIRQ